MKDLIVIIWLICFPLATNLSEYITVLKMDKLGKEQYKNDLRSTVNWIELTVFIAVLLLLLNN